MRRNQFHSRLMLGVHALLFCSLLFLLSCAPEVGSEKWCLQQDAKAKGDWTMNEAKDYAKHCLFKSE